MEHFTENSKGVARRKYLTRRIRRFVVVLSLTGLIAIVFLRGSLSIIAQNYSEIVNEGYTNTEYVRAVDRDLYHHQVLVTEHLITSSPQEKEKLERQINKLEEHMQQVLKEFGTNMKGHRYESYYHSIYSDIRAYLKNVSIIFDFSRNNYTETAAYYMDTSLGDYIDTVNQKVSEFEQLTSDDMSAARDKLNRNTLFVDIGSYILLFFILSGSFLGLMVCFRMYAEIVYTDAVTGAANYDRFLEIGEKYSHSGTLSEYAVLSPNIKDFKYMSSVIGTNGEEAVLTEYASRIAGFLEKGEVLARINNDNFIALIKKDRAEKILEHIKNMPVTVTVKNNNKKIAVQSRCGIYLAEEGDSISKAVNRAVSAMEESRKSSASDFVWYTHELLDKEKNDGEVIADFRYALANEQFKVYYQPKVDLDSQLLCGSEALVRWIRDSKTVPPAKFIPILEEKGYVTELDFYVFEQVCKDIARWKTNGIEPVRISVNFSKLHLKNAYFAEDIFEIMQKYGIESRYIEIELTESSGYEDFDAMTKFVDRMQNNGIYTAIDDFGTGYSSLSMLKDMDINVVKLDKSFLNGLENTVTQKVIGNIIKMITDLNKLVICEGVETEEQAAFLRSVSCRTVQGFLYDKPLPCSEFEERLKNPKYTGRLHD